MSVFYDNKFRIVVEHTRGGDSDLSVSRSKVFAPAVTTEVLTLSQAQDVLKLLKSSIDGLKEKLTAKSPAALYAIAREHASVEMEKIFGEIGGKQTQLLLSSSEFIDDTKLRVWSMNELFRSYKQYLFTLNKNEQIGMSDAAMLQAVKGVYQLQVPHADAIQVQEYAPLAAPISVAVTSEWLPNEDSVLKLGTKDGIYVARQRLGLGYLQDCFLDPVSDYVRKAVNGTYEKETQDLLNELKLTTTVSFAELNKETKLRVYRILNDIGLKRGQKLLTAKAMSKPQLAEILTNDLVVQLLNNLELLDLESFLDSGDSVTFACEKALLQCDYKEVLPDEYGLESFDGFRATADLPILAPVAQPAIRESDEYSQAEP